MNLLRVLALVVGIGLIALMLGSANSYDKGDCVYFDPRDHRGIIEATYMKYADGHHWVFTEPEKDVRVVYMTYVVTGCEELDGALEALLHKQVE